jgi:hypothetical protein
VKIEYKGNPPYHEFFIEQNVVTVKGERYDLDEIRKNTEIQIDIYDEDKNFVANIIIPPNEHEMVDTGKTDENGTQIYEKVVKPLNIEKVRLVVWQKHEKPKNNTLEEV